MERPLADRDEGDDKGAGQRDSQELDYVTIFKPAHIFKPALFTASHLIQAYFGKVIYRNPSSGSVYLATPPLHYTEY